MAALFYYRTEAPLFHAFDSFLVKTGSQSTDDSNLSRHAVFVDNSSQQNGPSQAKPARLFRVFGVHFRHQPGVAFAYRQTRRLSRAHGQREEGRVFRRSGFVIAC
jgi:hypothetical protein